MLEKPKYVPVARRAWQEITVSEELPSMCALRTASSIGSTVVAQLNQHVSAKKVCLD